MKALVLIATAITLSIVLSQPQQAGPLSQPGGPVPICDPAVPNCNR